MTTAKTAGPRAQQPLLISLTHWLNVPLLVIMCGSGLQIFAAFPSLGSVGALYRWYPLQGRRAPSWLTIGGWLAGSRHWHFAFAWLFVINGLIYLAYFCASGEWRRRLFFPIRDTRNALQTIGYYLRIRKEAPVQGLYNGLQRFVYTGVLLLFHRQTIVAYGMNGHPLTPAHGAPARLYASVKLGYKMVKYLTKVSFLPNRTGGYWEDQGYEWFAGV